MKQLLSLVLLILIPTQLLAQSANPQASKSNNSLKYSFGYFGFYKLNPKWGIQADVQYRMDENLKFTFQNVYRLGLIRYLNPNVGLAGGYAQFHTQSEAFEDYFTEHRFWEQVYYFKKINRRSMLFRFRMEQRFVEKLKLSAGGEVETEEFNYGNRLRFYHRTTFDLTKAPDAQNVFYVAFQDETFFNINAPEINRHFFDQNRFMFAFGVFKDKHTKLEMGYVNFFLNPSVGENIMVHSLNFMVIQNLDFSSQKQ